MHLCKILFPILLLAALPATAANLPTDYIDDDTVAIAHIDTQKIDPTALEKFANELLDAAKSPPNDQPRAALRAAVAIAKNHLTKFQSAGGRHIYLLLSHQDAWPKMEPLAILLPLENNADPKALQDHFKAILPPDITVTPLAENLLFVGQPAPLARLRTLKPAPRPDLQAGLAATSGSAVEIVISPTKDIRRAFAELLPRIPNDLAPDPLNASTEFLTRGLKAITLKLDLPPTPILTLSLEMENQRDAQQSTAFIEKLLQSLASNDDLANYLFHDSTINKNLNDERLPKEFRAFITNLKPQTITTPAGTSSTQITLDEKHIRSTVAILQPMIENAQRHARKIASQAKIHTIVLAGHQYAAAHQNEWPESLDVLVKEKILTEATLTNPADSKRQRYTYRHWTKDQRKHSESHNWPVVWETADADAPRSVGFLDGHAELVTAKDFSDRLKKAESQAAAQLEKK
jgi:hypothetical protein